MDDDKEADSCTLRRLLTHAGHVFQPFWVRHHFQNTDEYNRFILDYHRYFLPSIGFIIWGIFLVA